MPPKFQRKAPSGPALARVEIPEVAALGGVSRDLPRVFEAEVSSIAANPDQPRTVFDDETLRSLAASIERHGLQQPILVREADEKGRYSLVAGERRLRAHRLLGRVTIPAILTSGSPDEIALVENVQRVDLDAVDLARGLKRLMEQHDYTQAEAGAAVGLSESETSKRLRILRLPADILDDYRANVDAVKRTALVEVAQAEGEEEQRRLWALAKAGATMDELREARPKKTTAPPDPLRVLGKGILKIAKELTAMDGLSGALQKEHKVRLRELRDRINALLGE